MSSVINNSNANSAIVQTLDASVSKRNPQIYSTKEIYPAHSMTYVKNEKTNGSVTDGNSINFNLNKYGIASQILLHLEKTAVLAAGGADTAATLMEGDIFTIIKSVELLSSSRVISTLTANDLIAQFSDMTQDEYNVVFQKAINVGSSANANGKFVFVLPLVFGLFKDINTQPNLSFVEPMSLRVNFNKVGGFLAKTGGQDSVFSLNDQNCYLQIRYKAYPEASVAEVIDQNYSEPELNQLSKRFYDENTIVKTRTIAQGAAAEVLTEDIDLKNTDAVTDFYVIVRRQPNSGAAPADTDVKNNAPFKIKSVKFTGSGQDILNLTQDELAYARLTDNGNAVFPLEIATSTYGITNVVKIQTGLWNQYAMTNCFSLREINAPRISISFEVPKHDTEALTYEVSVVEDCLAIYSTSSATGRQVLSLTN
jgi:hypothetical protein